MRQLMIGFIFILFSKESVISGKIPAISKFYIKTISMDCYGNADVLVNITCKLKPLNWEKTIATMDSDLVGAVRNVTVRIELFKYTNQFRPFLINMTLNLCKILATGQGHTYGKIVANILSSYSNVNHSCPYTGHLAAYGFFIDSQFIPFFVPSGRYKISFTFHECWPPVHIGTAEFVGDVIERRHVSRAKQLRLYYTKPT